MWTPCLWGGERNTSPWGSGWLSESALQKGAHWREYILGEHDKHNPQSCAQGQHRQQSIRLTGRRHITSETFLPESPIPDGLQDKLTNSKWVSFYRIPTVFKVVLKTVKIIKSKESLRNCDNQEFPKETWWVDALWCPGQAPRTERTSEKRWGMYDI